VIVGRLITRRATILIHRYSTSWRYAGVYLSWKIHTAPGFNLPGWPWLFAHSVRFKRSFLRETYHRPVSAMVILLVWLVRIPPASLQYAVSPEMMEVNFFAVSFLLAFIPPYAAKLSRIWKTMLAIRRQAAVHWLL
jgi:hypothetical protein